MSFDFLIANGDMMHISWVSAFPASYQNTFITNLLSITIMIWHLLIVTTASTQLVA